MLFLSITVWFPPNKPGSQQPEHGSASGQNETGCSHGGHRRFEDCHPSEDFSARCIKAIFPMSATPATSPLSLSLIRTIS